MSRRSAYGLDSAPQVKEWLEHVACRLAPDLWFSGNKDELGVARHVCLTHCPVRQPCLDWAEQQRPTAGVYGGWVWVSNKHGGGKVSAWQPLAAGCGKRCKAWQVPK